MKISSRVVAEMLKVRDCSFFRVFAIGRLVIIWDTERPVPDRAPGAVK